MEDKKYHHFYWNKIIIFAGITFGIILISFYLRSRIDKISVDKEREEVTSEEAFSTYYSIVSTNIKWRDSTYCIVLRSIFLSSIVEKNNKDMPPSTLLHNKKAIKLSYKDTLSVDSLSFIELKEYMVTPQSRIDSIYKRKGIKGLISTYVDDENCLISSYNSNSLLSLQEERYIIYILQQYQYSFFIGDESGSTYMTPP